MQDVAFEIFRTYSSIADVVDEARRRPPGPILPAHRRRDCAHLPPRRELSVA